MQGASFIGCETAAYLVAALGAKDVMGGIGEALEAPAEPPAPRNHFTVRFRTEAPLPPEALSG